MPSLIRPLKLGSLTLPTNLIQGPLAGYSCAPMRELAWRFGGVGYCTTEMLSAHIVAERLPQARRFEYKSKEEKWLCCQLSGKNADVLARATERVVGEGADLVDLNCGCPQPKIRKKGHGSKLLADPEGLYQLLRSMRSVTDKPMSAKIRVDADSGERFNREVAQAIEAARMDFMVVHGRHWKERYDVAANFDEIAAFVNMVSIPVIANGDVDGWSSASRVLTATGAAGVMVSRAGLGRPWLFRHIEKQSKGEEVSEPGLPEREALFLEHVTGLVELDGEYSALLQARKLSKYYKLALPTLVRGEIDSLASLSEYLRAK